ncbi:MAG TPA: macro domain-containing protein [Candidatus Alectryocaccomicrobium excrementavium]|uniref:Macro domain-containing protein n=1 Tax=Candidatus Alectryocaccomicrobium excrementavium TaxID=2840668 RepID=A0A9D1G087_9FIRM|nr:macro domain-containing protein [Candidatus Alectryocaccomicrobium excrementavium]
MPFSLVRNDIVNMRVDAIVNAANSSLAPGGGVCGAIFAAAGRTALDKACRAIGHCDVGSAVITPGFDLPARYVIHAVGPIWQGGSRGEADLLHSCYTRALHLARENGCESIAFPLISSGIFGYPKPQALRVAINAIEEFLLKYEMQVYLVIFDRAALLISERLYENIQRYIDDRYVELRAFPRQAAEALPHARQRAEQADLPLAAPCATPGKRSLDDLLGHLDESFSRMLLRLIDEKGMTDVEVYKRANLDRKLFSKIRKEGYNPSKQTALALAIALRLNLDETKDLLGRAGYALSHSNKFDIIIEYFIEEGVYDIFEINEALFAFEQRLLGA